MSLSIIGLRVLSASLMNSAVRLKRCNTHSSKNSSTTVASFNRCPRFKSSQRQFPIQFFLFDCLCNIWKSIFKNVILSTVTQCHGDTVRQWHSGTVTQWHSDTVLVTQWHSDRVTQRHNDTVTQWHCDTVTQQSLLATDVLGSNPVNSNF